MEIFNRIFWTSFFLLMIALIGFLCWDMGILGFFFGMGILATALLAMWLADMAVAFITGGIPGVKQFIRELSQ